MIGTAWAQGPGGAAPPALVQMVPLLLVFAVFYFLLIRPQQRKQKEHRAMLANLKRNDEVVTSGGLYGTVVQISDQVVTLEIAPNVRVRVVKEQIASLVPRPGKKGADAEGKEKHS